jgi:hypothetical protein
MYNAYPLHDFVYGGDDFIGGATLATTVGEGLWKITDTSSAGTPTYTKDAAAHGGVVTLAFDSQTEVQNVCMDFGDKLQLDIDSLIEIEFRLKTVATLDSATTLVWGLQSGRNDNTDSTTNNAQFKLVGDNNVVVETDDGTTDLDDKATGKTLVAAYKRFVISFAYGKSDVRFFIDGDRVAASTTFSMAAATGQLQPFVQIQKTSDSNTDSVSIDYIGWKARRV